MKPTTKLTMIASKARQSSKTIPPCYYLQTSPGPAESHTYCVAQGMPPGLLSHTWAIKRRQRLHPLGSILGRLGQNFTLEFSAGSAIVRLSPRQKTDVSESLPNTGQRSVQQQDRLTFQHAPLPALQQDFFPSYLLFIY